MKNKVNECYKSIQSILIILIIISIFSYIGIDIFIIKPEFRQNVNEVKEQYFELNSYLEENVPKIKQELLLHKEQISKQDSILQSLQRQIYLDSDIVELYPD